MSYEKYAGGPKKMAELDSAELHTRLRVVAAKHKETAKAVASRAVAKELDEMEGKKPSVENPIASNVPVEDNAAGILTEFLQACSGIEREHGPEFEQDFQLFRQWAEVLHDRILSAKPGQTPQRTLQGGNATTPRDETHYRRPGQTVPRPNRRARKKTTPARGGK